MLIFYLCFSERPKPTFWFRPKPKPKPQYRFGRNHKPKPKPKLAQKIAIFCKNSNSISDTFPNSQTKCPENLKDHIK